MLYRIFVHMRRAIAIFFTLIMLSVSFKEIVQYAAFKLNQDSISALFCINKDKPELKCDGKCYLKKSIQASEKENKQSKPVPPPDEKSLVVYFENSFHASNASIAQRSNPFFNYVEFISFLLHQDIPHPPEGLT